MHPRTVSAPRSTRRDALTLAAVALGTTQMSPPRAQADTLICAFPIDAPPASIIDCTADAAALAGIQASLDARADALESGDRAAFLATIDPANPTWRRIQTEYIDTAISAHRGTLRGTAVSLQAKPNGYVRAALTFATRGSRPSARGSWVFRADENGVWRHAEPTNEELGARLIDDRGTFVISHYEWDADVIDRIAVVTTAAWAKVGNSLALPTSVRPTISLNPTYASHSGLRGANTWAAYLPGSRGTVLLRSPDSYGGGTTDPTEGADERLLIPLTHELTHLVNDDIISIVRIPHWMSEGLAEHVADHMRGSELAVRVRSDAVWTLDKASEVIEWGTDPSRGNTPADVSLAYAHAAHGVRFFVSRFDLDRFWALARAFADSRMWDRSFQQVTGITWETFGADWRSWLRKQFP